MQLIFCSYSHNLTHPSHKGNVEAAGVGVDKLEGEELNDECIIILGLCAVILWKQEVECIPVSCQDYRAFAT